MPIDIAYRDTMRNNAPGTIAGSGYDVKTGNCETDAGIGFGLAVSQGTISDDAVVLGGTLSGFKGITVKDINRDTRSADKYQKYEEVGYLNRDEIWVVATGAVADGAVYFDGTTGAILASSGGGAIGPIPGARFKTSADDEGRCVVYLAGVADRGL